MPIKQDVKHIGITGIILAGGRSSRMGTSKAFVKFHGVSMLERMIQIVATVCDDAIVIASQGQRLPKIDVTVYRDKIPHQGPLGGILVGLGKAKNDICFLTSCDMPLLKPEIITFMSRLLTKEFDCVVPEANGYLNPLCAVYRRGILPTLVREFEIGRRSACGLVRKLRTKIVSRVQWSKVAPNGLSFENVNTPRQLKNLEDAVC